MALSWITPTRRLRTDAAASYKRMRKAGMPSTRIESAHRSRAAQQKLRDAWLRYKAGTGPKVNFALDPDDSNHVKGTAMDAHGPAQDWMVKHGPEHGWKRDKNELWHFDYDEADDKVLARARLRSIQKTLGVPQTGRVDAATTTAWQQLKTNAR